MYADIPGPISHWKICPDCDSRVSSVALIPGGQIETSDLFEGARRYRRRAQMTFRGNEIWENFYAEHFLGREAVSYYSDDDIPNRSYDRNIIKSIFSAALHFTSAPALEMWNIQPILRSKERSLCITPFLFHFAVSSYFLCSGSPFLFVKIQFLPDRRALRGA